MQVTHVLHLNKGVRAANIQTLLHRLSWYFGLAATPALLNSTGAGLQSCCIAVITNASGTRVDVR